MNRDRPQRVAVVVVGDVGRSPRMQYHALALANAGAEVDLIGVLDSEPFAGVRNHLAIHLRALSDGKRPADGSAVLGRALVRAVWQAVSLFRRLALQRRAADVILVQNPPAIPTMAVALCAARLRRARLVIDWHNLGYAMLAQRLGGAHPAVQLAARYEAALGRRADAHLCVSRGMQRALAERWGIEAALLYDRPAQQFVPLPSETREHHARELCRRVGLCLARRPVIVVSPTSWTADEDFALLFEALAECEARLDGAPDETRPQLLVLLTGKGPLRPEYEARLARLRHSHVHARALWLPADEYPMMLASADLGLSLHRSASGLDLPMKISDMMGAGLPVCALDYGACLRELVRPGENAVLFSSASELADRLCDVLRRHTTEAIADERLRSAATAATAERWEDAWKADAAPVILGDREARGS